MEKYRAALQQARPLRGSSRCACEQVLRYKPDFELARNNLQYAREKLKVSGK
jgi:hypothetical protein